MKLSAVNVRGALYSLGKISMIDKDDFLSFVYVIGVLKDINEDDADIPKEFSCAPSELRDKERFIRSCEELTEKGYCEKVSEGRYCFTSAGAHILEKWASLNIPVCGVGCPLAMD